MDFDSTKYGPDVARLLALDENGNRLFPVKLGSCTHPEARTLLKSLKGAELFPSSKEPEAPMAGLWLYFSCFDEAHELADYCESKEGNLWHAILHRLEGDFGNAAYWFRKAGQHPVYATLAPEAVRITKRYPAAEFRTGRWDPFAFLAFIDRARLQPGSQQEQVVREIQRVEWQILFDYCARPPQ
jgi:hypothetical protein